MNDKKIAVIGAGLAGVEAAHALALNGINVDLYEMKPIKYSPAHSYSGFAELVCSNSLKAERIESAAGLLKEEMKRLGSITIQSALLSKVPAGGALAVDREMFSDLITNKIKNNPKINVICGEIEKVPECDSIICTGPLTDGKLAKDISYLCGKPLSFFDAAAPIVTKKSINMEKAFFAVRYDKGGADYINCPMNEDEYKYFYSELIKAETAPLHDIDKDITVYEGCLPVEILAKRGLDSVRYGCMKPVGLRDPRTEKRPYACVQLRTENKELDLYNIVGFQTNLKFGEQKRIFRLIPGLENAEFVRYGVMHRNSFLNSPELLDSNFMLKGSENIYFAGQITGVEGYMESAASGIVAGISLARKIKGQSQLIFPKTTMIGALAGFISNCDTKNFQPMGANMGILPPLDEPIKVKQERYRFIANRALNDLDILGTVK